jgi:hypothetical protein
MSTTHYQVDLTGTAEDVHLSGLDSYKLNLSLRAIAPTPKPQSGLFVYGVKLLPT